MVLTLNQTRTGRFAIFETQTIIILQKYQDKIKIHYNWGGKARILPQSQNLILLHKEHTHKIHQNMLKDYFRETESI